MASKVVYKNGGSSPFYTIYVTCSVDNNYNDTQAKVSWESYITFGNWFQWGVRLKTYVNGEVVGNKAQACTSTNQTVCKSSGTLYITKGTSSQTINFSATTSSETVNDYGGIGSSNIGTASGSFSVSTRTSYTITFNANGGVGGPKTATKYHDIDLTIPSTKPTRDNYGFLGWNTEADGSGYYAVDNKITSNESKTMYAIWQANVSPCELEPVINQTINYEFSVLTFTIQAPAPSNTQQQIDTCYYMFNHNGVQSIKKYLNEEQIQTLLNGETVTIVEPLQEDYPYQLVVYNYNSANTVENIPYALGTSFWTRPHSPRLISAIRQRNSESGESELSLSINVSNTQIDNRKALKCQIDDKSYMIENPEDIVTIVSTIPTNENIEIVLYGNDATSEIMRYGKNIVIPLHNIYFKLDKDGSVKFNIPE
jgi:uncharacterized repeat protein (TIGR02543 family)